MIPEDRWERWLSRPRLGFRQRWINVGVRLRNRLPGRIPVPPGRLLQLVQASAKADEFVAYAEVGAACLRDILARNGLSLEGFRAVLDFGCGAGRILRCWSDLRGPELHGTDIHPRLIAWDRRHLRFARFQVNPLRGRLPFAAGRFDLIFALSVFTHLGEDGQRFWMSELQRVLSPGGHLLFSVHGDFYRDNILACDRAAYQGGRMVSYSIEREGSNICTAYHPYPYVVGVLADGLALVDFIPEGALGNPRQDVYLFRKPLS